MARKMPVPKNWDLLNAIKDIRYQVGTKAEQHKKPLERGMPSRSSVRWYLTQCKDNANQAAWCCVLDRELILSTNKEYCQELLQLSEMMLIKYGKLSTVWNKSIALECDELYAHIYNDYEWTRQQRMKLVEKWIELLDPDNKLYEYKFKTRKKRVGHSRSLSRRVIKRLAGKLLDKYGKVEDNPTFTQDNWGKLLDFQTYIYTNAHKGYDANEAFKLFE